MASSDENLDDSDEEMICCHVCLLKFNSLDRKPKFLDCHHFFCFRCIKAFSKGNTVSCPTCRHVTNMTGREIEDLATNNIVLRLVTIALERAREKAERGAAQKAFMSGTPNKPKIVKVWCVECSVPATSACQRKEHMMCDFAQVFMENVEVLENRAQKCDRMWDKAIEDRQKIQRVYGDVLESLRILQSELTNRIELNNTHIAQMESKKKELREIAATDIYKASASEDATIAMANLGKTITKVDTLDADANKGQFTAQRLLQNLSTIEENCIGVSFSNISPDKGPLRSIELLKKLQLSFSGSHHSEPIVKACVSIVSFLILKLAEEQSKHGAARKDNNRQMHMENIDNLCRVVPNRKAGSGSDRDGNDADSESGEENGRAKAGRAVAVNNKQAESDGTTFRDKLLRPTVKPGQEWQTVATKSPVKPKPNVNEWQTVSKPVKALAAAGGSNKAEKCYFRFSIDGVMMDRVVFQLDHASAPIMAAKFVEMCTTKTGYQGSRIFKNAKGESVMGGSRWFHSPNEDDVRKDIFTADRSGIKEKRGSIRFQVKAAEYPRADVSTEFQIILQNRPSYHKCTTVFGHIIEGLSLCDKISEMNVKARKVVIAECGTC